MTLATLLVCGALAAPPSIGNVAFMSFGIEAPYGLTEVTGRRPDGSVVMTGNGAWFRAGYGDRNAKLEVGQPGQPPALSGFVATAKEATVVGGHPAAILVGTANQSDGTKVVYFNARVTGTAVVPFVVEAVVPAANADAWVVELKRTLASLELIEE